jgi:hypothetical protein
MSSLPEHSTAKLKSLIGAHVSGHQKTSFIGHLPAWSGLLFVA